MFGLEPSNGDTIPLIENMPFCDYVNENNVINCILTRNVALFSAISQFVILQYDLTLIWYKNSAFSSILGVYFSL